MSDDVKSTRFHRRRRRTRRKKAVVTIESLHPGRAPLGYQPSPSLSGAAHHDASIVTASPSEWPESENSFQPPSPCFQSPPRSLPSVPAAHSIPAKLSPQIESPQTSHVAQSENHPASLLSNAPGYMNPAKPPLKLSTSQCEKELFPRDSSSAPPVNKEPSEPATVSQNFFSMSDDISETPKAFATATAPEGLEDIGELASSRPIALSQLYTKGNSRTKSGRAVKAFMAHLASENKPELLSPATTFPKNGQNMDEAQLPDARHEDDGEYSGTICNDDSVASRMFAQGERDLDSAENAAEQVWQRRTEAHRQQNPLTYSDGIGTYYISQPQEPSCVSESPFLKNSSYRPPEQDLWSAEAHSIPQHPRSASRKLMSSSEYIPESSLHLYRASFDRPENQSPYGSMRLQHSTFYENVGSYEAPSAEMPPQERYKDYAIIKSGTMLTALPKEESRSQTYKYSTVAAARAQAPARVLASIASGTGLMEPNSTLKLSSKSKLDEEATRFLDRFVKNPASHIKQAALPDPFVEPEPKADLSARTASESYQPSEKLALLAAKLGEYTNDSHRRLSTDRHGYTEHATLRSLCESAITDIPLPRKFSPVEDSSGKLKENYDQVHAELQNTATRRIIRPPPGLPTPTSNRMMPGELFSISNSVLAKTPSDDANAWFHKDPRGEEHLRQQVAMIAQTHAERIERLTGNDGTTAKQMNLLLGNVIVNLRSHFAENNQSHAARFATFEGENTFEEAPSFARRRSYFDRDPSVSYWRFPLRNSLPDDSRHLDRTGEFSFSDHKAR